MERPIEQQIVERALKVQRLGEYIGAFELLCWSLLEEVEVGLIIGGCVHSIREIFMPSRKLLSGSVPTHHFVACCIWHSPSRTLMAVDTTGAHPAFGHYVIGTPLPGHAHEGLDPVSGGESLRAVCLRLGFRILETQQAGDCAIDTMCYHKGLPRNTVEFKKVRARLSAFMQARAGDDE